MVRFAIALAVLSSMPAQNPGEFVASRGGDLHKLTAAEVVRDARLAGVAPSTADVIAVKRALRAMRGKKTARGHRRFDITRPAIPGGHARESTLSERENNDTLGLADRLDVPGCLDGWLASIEDRDVFSFEVDVDSDVDLSMAPLDPNGPFDPYLEVRDPEGNLVAEVDDSGTSRFPAIRLWLPEGEYRVVTRALSGAGKYTLSVNASPRAPAPVTVGQTIAGNLSSADGDVYSLSVPQDSRVDVTVDGMGLDPMLIVSLASGATHHAVDDSASGLGPAFSSTVVAGQYYLQVLEFGGQLGAYSIRVDLTAGASPAPCNSLVSSTLAGEESLDLYRIRVVSPERLSFTVFGLGPAPLVDSILTLYDAELGVIALNDDDGANLLSRLDVMLPAGTYFLGVTGFAGSPGEYRLTGSCAPTATPPAIGFGETVASLSTPAESAAFAVTINTPNSVLAEVLGLRDPMVAVLNATTGLLEMFDDDGGLDFDARGSAMLDPGDYWILVREFANGTGSFSVGAKPPLWYDVVGIARVPTSIVKANDLQFLLASVSESPPTPVLPGLVEGFLLVDYNRGLVVGSLTAPATGIVQWPTIPPLFGGALQAITFDNGSFPARFSDVFR